MMKSKLSLLVLLVEIAAVIILHTVKASEPTNIQASEKQIHINPDLANREVKTNPETLAKLNN